MSGDKAVCLDDRPLAPTVQRFLAWLERKGMRGSTIHNYRDTLSTLPADPLALDVPAIEAWIARPRATTKPVAAGTLRKDRDVLSSYYNWAMAEGLRGDNPAKLAVVPRSHRGAPKPVPDALWPQLWSSLEPFDQAWVGLMAFAGLRSHEVASLRVRQVDWRRGMLVGFRRKGGADDTLAYEDMCRIVGDPRYGLPEWLPDVEGYLHSLRTLTEARRGRSALYTGDDEPLCWWWRPANAAAAAKHGIEVGSPNPSALGKRFATLVRVAGLAHAGLTPHMLRHSAATNLLRCGVDVATVSQLLNHGSINTTMLYIKTSGTALQDWRRRMERGG